MTSQRCSTGGHLNRTSSGAGEEMPAWHCPPRFTGSWAPAASVVSGRAQLPGLQQVGLGPCGREGGASEGLQTHPLAFLKYFLGSDPTRVNFRLCLSAPYFSAGGRGRSQLGRPLSAGIEDL